MTEHKPSTETAVLLDENGAAVFLAVPVPTLRGWRQRGGGPQYNKMGRLVRYERAELEAFVAATKRRTTSEQR